MRYDHVGRPTNEEVSHKKRIRFLKIIMPFLIVVLIVLIIWRTDLLSNMSGNSVLNTKTCPDDSYSLNGNQCVKTEIVDSVILGDSNQDHKIDEEDLTAIKNVMMGDNSNSLVVLASDVNRDKNIDLLDYNEVSNYLSKQSSNSSIGTLVCPLDTDYISYKLENEKCVKTTVKDITGKKRDNKTSKKEYKIVFDANGGTFADYEDKHITKNIVGGLKYGKLPEISRKGYVFDGWYSGNKKITPNSIVTKSITVKAKWSVRSDKVTITFDGNGGIVKKYNGKAVDKLKVKKIVDKKYGALPKVKRSGYIFKGWFNGDSEVKENTKVEDEAIVKAKWKSKVYTINLSTSHGKLSNKSIKVKYGTKVNKLPELDSNKKFEFVGWYTAKDGKGRKIDNDTIVKINKNITLYAYWTRQ